MSDAWKPVGYAELICMPGGAGYMAVFMPKAVFEKLSVYRREDQIRYDYNSMREFYNDPALWNEWEVRLEPYVETISVLKNGTTTTCKAVKPEGFLSMTFGCDHPYAVAIRGTAHDILDADTGDMSP